MGDYETKYIITEGNPIKRSPSLLKTAALV